MIGNPSDLSSKDWYSSICLYKLIGLDAFEDIVIY